MTLAELETAFAIGAHRALTKRAAALRETAARLTTTTTDNAGRTVTIADPEAITALGTAQLFEACATDLRPTVHPLQPAARPVVPHVKNS